MPEASGAAMYSSMAWHSRAEMTHGGPYRQPLGGKVLQGARWGSRRQGARLGLTEGLTKIVIPRVHQGQVTRLHQMSPEH